MLEVAPEKIALYLGRFEPYHNGHHKVVTKQIWEDDTIEGYYIGIGSSENSLVERDPMNFAERYGGILESLKDSPKPFEIFGVPDKGDNDWWMRVLLEAAPGKFGMVITGNPLVARLSGEHGLEVRDTIFEYPICATDIRQMMKRGGDWQDHMPEQMVRKAVDIDLVGRIRSNFYKYKRPDVTADVILDCGKGAALIKRLHDPFAGQWAILGGFYDTGKETVPEAASRELKEEGHLERVITYDDWFRQYSDPKRDPRGPNIGNVFHIDANFEDLRAGDDAAEVGLFPWCKIPQMDLAFDHNEILDDYMKKFKRGMYEQ